MKRFSMTVIGLGIAAAALATQPGEPASQPAAKPADKPATNTSSLAGDAAYAPLREMIGEWDVDASFTLMPGAKPSLTKARMTASMTLGGLFLETRITGGSIGSPSGAIPWDATSFMGYDPGKKQYHVTRMSSTSPVPMPETGTYDKNTKTFTTEGEFQMVYAKLKVRTILKIVSENERHIEQHISFNDAPDFKGIEMTIKRRRDQP